MRYALDDVVVLGFHHAANQNDAAVRAVLLAHHGNKCLQLCLKVCGGKILKRIVCSDIENRIVRLPRKAVLGFHRAVGACVLVARENARISDRQPLPGERRDRKVCAHRLGNQIGVCHRCVLIAVSALVVADHAPTAADAVADEFQKQVLRRRRGLGNRSVKGHALEHRVRQCVARDLDQADGMRALGQVLQGDGRVALFHFVVGALAVEICRTVHIRAEETAFLSRAHVGGDREGKGHIALSGCNKLNARRAPVAGNAVRRCFHAGVKLLHPRAAFVQCKDGSVIGGFGVIRRVRRPGRFCRSVRLLRLGCGARGSSRGLVGVGHCAGRERHCHGKRQ